MATDLYIDGRRWRIRETANSRAILNNLTDNFGAVETIYALDVIDPDGNQGILRLDPSRLASLAIVAVDEDAR